VGRTGRRDKEEIGQREPLPNLQGHPKMAVVERVEGAAVDRDPAAPPVHYCRTWPSPKATNFVVVSSESPIGPKAWIFVVLMPISAPNPSW